MTERPTTTRNALRRLFVEVPTMKEGLRVTVALAVLGTALQVAIPIVVQQIIDIEILDPDGVDVQGATMRGTVALVAMACTVWARRESTLRLAILSARGLSDLRVRTFDRLHRMSALHTESERRGALVARVTSDVYRIQDFMEWGGMGMLIGVSQVSLSVVAMLLYQWQLALMVVAGVALYGLMLFWFQRVLGRAHDRVRDRVSDSMSAVSESITGLTVVRAYGAEGPTLHRVRNAVDEQFSAEFRTSNLGSALFSSAEIFAGVLTAGVVAAGILLGTEAGVTAGSLLAFLFLVNLLVQPVQTLVETLDTAQAAAAGMRRVLAVFDTPLDLEDPGEKGVDLPEGPLAIRVDGLCFRYPESTSDVLSNVSVEIAAGRRVAVVGETGSGKTTFAKLLVRLLDPTAGSIDVGGVPVDTVRFASLRKRVAYVPQEGFLFDATVGDNVRYGRPNASDEEIRRAFADLSLTAWLDSLPSGLDTEVGERGSQLSAGERQLVALVRAWMSQPDALVLDEATSAVDPALEVQLRNAIDRLIRGRTSITIAHRLSTAEASDEVMVFAAGVLVEHGPHATLLENGGRYTRMHVDWMAGSRG